MNRPKFLHEILESIVSGMVFTIKFSSATDNSDGTFTLNDVCDFHHIQTGSTVTIDGHDYIVTDYDYDEKTILLTGTDAISVTSFTLDPPFLFHGTPLQQNTELGKIPDIQEKTPMIYLMEPYQTEYDDTNGSAIAYRSDVTLCFLTEADMKKWQTEDYYHNAITPMKNLYEDFMQALIDSNLFYTSRLKPKPTYYTKFGITLTKAGTSSLIFSELFSGVGVELRMEVYKGDEECCEA